MGFDRGILPPDRDREDTRSWKGVVAAVIIVLGLLLAFYLSFRIGVDAN